MLGSKNMILTVGARGTALEANDGAIDLGVPRAEDGAQVNALVSRCKPLDENSVYCNLLQCSHFAETSVIAKRGEQVIGFVSGYLVPKDPSALFVWQVAVDDSARGQGLAKKMILDILARPVCESVSELHTTITTDNTASQALFTTVAKELDTSADTRIMFDHERHLGGTHASEHLWVIGPFARAPDTRRKAA